MKNKNEKPGILDEMSDEKIINFNSSNNEINIKPLYFNELIKSKVNPLEHVLYPFLPTQGIGFIYAATGVGKTLFSMNMAYCISRGGNFLKYKAKKPRKVLYIDGEMPFNQIHQRMVMISEQQGKLDFPENFSILTPDKVSPYRIPMIDDQQGQYIYNKLFDDEKIEVVFLDNLSMLSSIDENKSNEWKIVQDWILSQRALGRTIIIIHHAGKDKHGYRGTSRMLDCADTAISLQPVFEEGEGEEEDALTKKFKIVYQKSRLFTGNESISFEAILKNGIWKHESVEISLIDRIISCLNANMSQREIARELLISQPKVNRLIKKAKLTGRVI